MAETNEKNILQVWLNWTVGIIATIILALLTTIGNNVIANDRLRSVEDARIELRIMNNEVQIAETRECIKGIKEDLQEIKSILKRTSPYERER